MVTGRLPQVGFCGGGDVGIAFLHCLAELQRRTELELVGGVVDGVIHSRNTQTAAQLGQLCPQFDSVERLLDANPQLDAIVSVGNRHMFQPEVISRPGLRIINFHAAPLPEYRGSACPAFAILAGDDTFGSSFHLVSEELDEGPLLHVERFEIEEGHTAADVDALSVAAGLGAFNRLGGALLSMQPRPQSEGPPARRRRELEPYREVDLQWAPRRILRHVRAFDWPGVLEPAFARIGGKQVFMHARCARSEFDLPSAERRGASDAR